MHIVEIIARVPDESISPARPENQVELLVKVAFQVGLRQKSKVIHDPPVTVKLLPLVTIGWGRRQGVGRVGGHVVEQAFTVEVEVAHVAVESGSFLAAGFAEDDRVNV